jgi:3-oxoacyl-[acyl-carrier protein] reductase
MDLGIKHRVALVTGSSGGLGFATALQLAKEGVSVAINSRSIDNLEKAAASMREVAGYEPCIIEGDLTERGMAERIVGMVHERLGPIDILVSNAGGPPSGKFMHHSSQVWSESIELTLLPAIDLARAVIPEMKKRKWGRVVFITSTSAKQPSSNLIISNTLRAGVTGLSKSLSNEFAEFGITVNTVCPGLIDTERTKEWLARQAKQMNTSIEEAYDICCSTYPAKRVGKPNELAALIAFVCSESAGFINGTSIPADGGKIKGLL